MTKKEQLLYLRDQAKKSGDVNLKKLVALGAQSGKQSPENQKKIWAKVEQVVKKFKDAEQAAEKAQKASVAKKVAAKPKSKPKSSAKKAKSSPASKPTKKSGRGPKSRGETFFGRAKMIREQNPSLTWKEAQAEAKKFFADEKSRKAKAVQDAIKSFPNLKKATKDTTNIQKDAAQPAMPPGKRKSRPGAKRKFYWESRSNRSDIRQPSKKYPMLAKGGNRFKRGGKIDKDFLYPSVMAGRPEWKQIYDLTDRDPQGLYATLSPAQIELLKTIWNKQTSNGITTFMDVGQGLLVRSKSGTPSKEMYDAAIASVAEVPGIGGFQVQGKNEVFLDYASSDVFLDVIRPMMDSEMEYDGKEFLEAKIGSEAGYPFEKGGSLSTSMGMDVDEDGFPEDLDVSLDLRKKVRMDEKFAQKVREAIIETSTMSSMDVQEAARIFRELGIDMDYDLGGDPIGMSLMKKSSRFQKGGRVVIRSPKGKNAPNLIQRVDDKMWFMWTKPRPYGRISCQTLVGYQEGLTVQGFLDEIYEAPYDSDIAVDWMWMSPDSILFEELKREKVTDFEYEMIPVQGRKFTSGGDYASVRTALLAMGVPKQFAEEAAPIIFKGSNLEKGGNVSKFAEGGSVDADVKAILNDLKKGDRIVLDYTGGMASGQMTMEFVSKRRVGKGKTWEKDKWTFKNPNNPKGVKYFAYASDGGVPRFAVGNLAISPTSIKKVQK